jgi:nuclear pore complex protein Nup107
MWAHIQHRMELRIDKRWHELGGFWEAEDQLYGSDDVENIDIGRGGLDEVFASIAAVNSGAVSQASQNPYYVAQRMVILGRAASLLETFADRIPGLEQTVLPE